MTQDENANVFSEFVAIIRALRTPETGCPWDLEQTHQTLRPYLIEEAYEALDAIDQSDDLYLREELGDVLLQVVLHAQIAADRGVFTITDVVRDISEKMVRRHPHVFGATRASTYAEVMHAWEDIKASESRAKLGTTTRAAGLARLPKGLPALLRASRLGEKAASNGCDAASIASILASAREQFARIEQALNAAEAEQSPPAVENDLGEVLFSLSQLARWLGLSAEDSLRASNQRFIDRFRRMEQQAPRPLAELTPAEVAAEFEKAKADDNP